MKRLPLDTARWQRITAAQSIDCAVRELIRRAAWYAALGAAVALAGYVGSV